MKVTPKQAITMLTGFLMAKLVPMLAGSPGIGKSEIVHKIAKEYNLLVIDRRLSQCDPCDLSGFASIDNGKADYMPMKFFPVEGDPIPNGYSGWLLFLDEFNSAPQAVQAAAYQLVLDRMVGSHKLHKNVAIVCAGNLETDNAIVQPMSTALQSRLVHIELSVDVDEWLDWAGENGLDHRISDYIQFKPSNLFTFSPDHTDKTYGCPRTWAFADRVLKVTSEDSKDRLPMLAGTLSEGVAREFMAFCEHYKDLPKLPKIMADPEGTKVPVEPSVLYALSGSLSQHVKEDNITAVMKYLARLPVEFQVFCAREISRRKKELMMQPAFQKWVAASGLALF